MAKVSTYLNFTRNTEEAFNFYRSVFGGEFVGGISRFRDIPSSGNTPPISEDDKDLVMHIALPIMDGHMLMGTDAPESMQFRVTFGNNVYVTLHPDTRAETDGLFKALSQGGKVETEPQEMFWGDYYASLCDRFGVQWMLICSEKAK